MESVASKACEGLLLGLPFTSAQYECRFTAKHLLIVVLKMYAVAVETRCRPQRY